MLPNLVLEQNPSFNSHPTHTHTTPPACNTLLPNHCQATPLMAKKCAKSQCRTGPSSTCLPGLCWPSEGTMDGTLSLICVMLYITLQHTATHISYVPGCSSRRGSIFRHGCLSSQFQKLRGPFRPVPDRVRTKSCILLLGWCSRITGNYYV